jgi:uncharacterized protein
MRVESLHYYPVKGMRGSALTAAEVTAAGFTGDRRWMLVDPTGRFISQREEPRLALIDVAIEGRDLIARAPGMPALRVAPPAPLETLPVTIWRDELPAYPAPAEAHAWFSDFLAMPCRLVYQGDSIRGVDPRWSQPGDITSFADAYPLLVCTTASLDDLARRVGTALPMDRFRPNIVVAGDDAWAEDEWARLRIGQVEMDLTKPCARCSVTTVDQMQGIRTGKEPLRTLAGFRFLQVPGISGVIFGQNAIPRVLGRITVGQEVEVLERQPRPAFKQATLAQLA